MRKKVIHVSYIIQYLLTIKKKVPSFINFPLNFMENINNIDQVYIFFKIYNFFRIY